MKDLFMTFNAKKTALALACALVTATSAFAQTAPSVTLYGFLDLGLESNNDGALTKTMLQNYSTRFGLKGERSLSSDLTGMFQIETLVSPDDAKNQNTTTALGSAPASGQLASRNSFIGLKSNTLGTFMAGNYDTPFKSLKAGITLFGNVHTRQPNSFIYFSPKFSNIVVKALYSPDEGQTATSNAPTYSLSAEWNDGTYNFGVATQNKAVSGTAIYAMSANKVTMGAVMGSISGALAFTTLDNQATLAGNARKISNAMGTVNYTVAPWIFKVSYAQSSESFSGANDGITETALEAQYNLDKATFMYVGYSQINNSANAKGSYAGGNADNSPAASAYGVTPSALTFGMRYVF